MLKSLRKKEENDLCLSQFNSFLTILLIDLIICLIIKDKFSVELLQQILVMQLI